MNDIVLGIRLTADGKDLVGAVQQSSEAIDKMGDATKRAASEAAKLNAEQKGLSDRLNVITQAQVNANYQAQQASEAWQRQHQAIAGASDEIQKILNRYDPLGTKLRQLQSDFSALDKAIAAGATGGTSDLALDKAMKAMNEDIAKTKGLMEQAGAASAEGFGKAEKGAIASAFSTAQARRELIVLGHEAMTGNFSRMPGSFMVLANRIGLSGGALVSVLLPLAAVGAAAVVLIKAFADGAAEAREMNNALALTSDYAGMTRGTMRELAQEMTTTGAITVGTAKGIVTQLVASGQVGALAIGAVAKLASDYAAATGKDVAKIAPELEKLFADPAKGAEELNKQMHFLSPAEIEHIAHLERIGQLDAAQLDLAEKMAAHIPKQIEQLGLLGSAWDSVKKYASGAWDSMLGVGRPKTLEETLKEAKAFLAAIQSPEKPLSGGQAARQAVDAATFNLYSAGEAAAYNQSVAETSQLQNQAAALVKQTSEYAKIRDLQDQITNIRKNAPDDADKTRAIYDKQKQIFDIQRGMGAESRNLQQQEIEGTLHLREIAIGMAQAQNDAQLKLHAISQADHDATKTFFELQKNQVQQLAVMQLASVKGLNVEEKKKYEWQLLQLKAQAQAIELSGDNKLLEDRNALLTMQADLDAKSAAASVDAQLKVNTSLDEQIKKLREHNLEIGKTKTQVDELKAAETEQSIARMQFFLNMESEEGVGEGNLYVKTLTVQIAKLRELQGLQTQGAALEAQSHQIKQLADDAKAMDNDIRRGLTDALMRGFDSGKGFLKNFWDSAVNMAKTVVLRPVISFLVSPISGAITAALSGMGLSGAAGAMGTASAAAGAAGGGFNLFAGGVSGAAGMVTGGANSIFQNAGVAMGSQWIADIGNYGFGLPFISGLVMAATGNVAGGIGSALGGIAGSFFGSIGTVVGSTLGGMIGSMFGGGDERQGQLIGTGVTGKISRAGFSGSMASNWGTGPDDRWGGTTLSPIPASAAATINNTINNVFTNMADAAKKMGLSVTGLDSIVVDFTTSSKNGDQVQNDLNAALNATSDAIAEHLIPGIKYLQLNGESLTQTFARLSAAQAALDAQRRTMEIQLMEAQGRTVEALAAKREDELKALDPSLRALQQQIYAAEDLANAAKDVANAANDATGAMRSLADIAHERYGLETQLLQLQGKTVELRARELAALDASNRALQEAIYAEEDLAAARKAAQDEALNATDAQANAAQKALSAAQNAGDTWRNLSTTLTDAMTQLRGGPLSALNPAQKYAGAGSNAEALYTQMMTGDAAAAAKLPQAITDWLNTSRTMNASGPAYTADYNRAMDMLSQAQTLSAGKAGEQDKLAGLLQDEIDVLVSIRTILESPAPDSVQLIAQTALLGELQKALTDPSYTIPQALQDQIKATGAMIGTTSASIDRVVQAVDALTALVNPSSAAAVASATTGTNGMVLGVGGTWQLPGYTGLISAIPGHATGLNYVPRDDYLMRAHRGEAVLTAPQAATWRGGGAANEGLSGAVLDELKKLREDYKILMARLAAVIEAGDGENVKASNNIADSRAAIARQEALERRAHRKVTG
jgi:hypothetical protein